jgi:hypothetical protein
MFETNNFKKENMFSIIERKFNFKTPNDLLFFLRLNNKEMLLSDCFFKYKTNNFNTLPLFGSNLVEDLLIFFSNSLENSIENIVFNNENLKYDIVDMDPVTWKKYDKLRHFISPKLLCIGMFEHGNLLIDQSSRVYYNMNDLSEGDYELERTPKIADSLTEFLGQLIEQNSTNPEIDKLKKVYEEMKKAGF